jgi:hypothetical protein
MGAGAGFKTFVTGDVLTAADTNGYLMQGVWVFADAAARNAAVTSPQEGNFCYLKDTNATQFYSGSAWVAVGGTAGLTFINSGTFTTSSAVSLATSTFTTTYTNYLIQFTITACSAGNDLGLRGRTSGTDLSTTVYDYAVNGGKTNSTTYTFGGTSADRIYISSMTTGTPYRGSITLFSPQTTDNTYVSTNGLGTESNLGATANAYGNARTAAQFDAATIFPSTGTITGFYNVYGFSNS